MENFHLRLIYMTRQGLKYFFLPFKKKCDEAWNLAEKIQTDVARGVLDMYVIDETLEAEVRKFATRNRL